MGEQGVGHEPRARRQREPTRRYAAAAAAAAGARVGQGLQQVAERLALPARALIRLPVLGPDLWVHPRERWREREQRHTHTSTRLSRWRKGYRHGTTTDLRLCVRVADEGEGGFIGGLLESADRRKDQKKHTNTRAHRERRAERDARHGGALPAGAAPVHEVAPAHGAALGRTDGPRAPEGKVEGLGVKLAGQHPQAAVVGRGLGERQPHLEPPRPPVGKMRFGVGAVAVRLPKAVAAAAAAARVFRATLGWARRRVRHVAGVLLVTAAEVGPWVSQYYSLPPFPLPFLQL